MECRLRYALAAHSSISRCEAADAAAFARLVLATLAEERFCKAGFSTSRGAASRGFARGLRPLIGDCYRRPVIPFGNFHLKHTLAYSILFSGLLRRGGAPAPPPAPPPVRRQYNCRRDMFFRLYSEVRMIAFSSCALLKVNYRSICGLATRSCYYYPIAFVHNFNFTFFVFFHVLFYITVIACGLKFGCFLLSLFLLFRHFAFGVRRWAAKRLRLTSSLGRALARFFFCQARSSKTTSGHKHYMRLTLE